MIPNEHWEVAQRLDAWLRKTWGESLGQPVVDPLGRNCKSPQTAFGILEKVVEIVPTDDVIEVRLVRDAESGAFAHAALTELMPRFHADGVPVVITQAKSARI